MNEILNLYAKDNGETIGEHTQKLLDGFEIFKKIYGDHFDEKTLEEIKIACNYHDYGKSALVFQKKIKNTDYISKMEKSVFKKIMDMYAEIGHSDNIPHGYVSPMFIPKSLCIELKEKYGADSLKRIVTAIMLHHTRSDRINTADLKRTGKEDLEVRYGTKLNTRIYSCIYNDELCDDKVWADFSVVLGMLNKFDYHASDREKEKLPVEIERKYNGKYLNEYVADFFEKNNFSLNNCQKYAVENSDKNIIITASTGIGKTETALLWAKGEKLFYTLPLKVSINAMYSRIRDNYGYSSEKVTLLHSSALEELIDMNENSEEMTVIKYDASRKFSYPVTVCTVDQLFSFVYKYHGCEQYIATLKYSRLVIDEIQSYEPETIAKILWGLKIITLAGGKFAIITATLPPFVYEQIRKMNIECSLPENFLISDKIRHKVRIVENDDFDFDEILQKASDSKVLIICNTVKRACEVYSRLKNCNYIKLLHSRFILKDRRKIEDEVIRFANDPSAHGICVSTQIVEASLDIDFDVLYTEMSTADSLLQRMGRCYRKRDYSKKSEPNVNILVNGNGRGCIYDKDIFDRSLAFLRQFDQSFFTESDKLRYIQEVYCSEQIKQTDYFKAVIKEIENIESRVPFIYTKSEAKKKFRNISSFPVIPQSIYDANIEKFDRSAEVLCGKVKSDRLERLKHRIFVQENSISISNFSIIKKYTSPVNFSGYEYFIAQCRYDFDPDTIQGIGLTGDFDDESNFF